MAEKLKTATEKAAKAKDVDSLRKVLTFPGERTLKDLARDCVQYKRKGGEQTERASKLIREAKDSKHLHPAAFRRALALADMEEGKRAIFLAHFDHYREKLGLDNIKQGSLNFDPDKPEEKTGDAVDAKPDKKATTKKNGKAEERATSLVNPKDQPSPEAVKEIADRAEREGPRPISPLN